MTDNAEPAWKARLKNAISKNKRDAHNRYIQLATVAEDGTPRVRMVVFRGFGDTDSSALMITDTRSEKISELQRASSVEIGWYFTHTREQFRLRCTARIHDERSKQDGYRLSIWSALSESAREQFFWRTPGEPLGGGDSPPPSSNPPETFAVVELIPSRVDHLILAKTQLRVQSELVQGSWQEQSLNP